MRWSAKQGSLVAALTAAALAAGTAIAVPALAAQGETNVATCDDTVGGSITNWRSTSDVAGPLGIMDGTLQAASRTHNGQFVAKMPLVIEGHELVTLSVPPRLRGRVFLYYGKFLDRDGEPARSPRNAAGFSAIEFQPCPGDRETTAWPGGIRVRGTGAVHLAVTVAGRSGSYVLKLGRPKDPFE